MSKDLKEKLPEAGEVNGEKKLNGRGWQSGLREKQGGETEPVVLQCRVGGGGLEGGGTGELANYSDVDTLDNAACTQSSILHRTMKGKPL